ncbi:helix-turn-helix transcriptional regulator [Aquimarina spinulae]|uniref:helix-turn-helix transcriptional regulator n=1 Tax=Aquimarina spinulae TaxID=1192023 RepID=UPI000D557586|nr:AraC family transcriptional regulator [Aquimarina spinulae]
MPLDNLEFLSITDQAQDFPMHYHDTFCISYVRSGIEQTQLQHQTLLCSAGAISITHPYEVHTTPVLDKDIGVSFDTLYLSNDVVKFFLNGKTLHFSERVIHDNTLIRLFFQLKEAQEKHDLSITEQYLKNFIRQLSLYSTVSAYQYDDCIRDFNTITCYIENNLTQKISLEDLAKIANINKFSFTRKFRTETGLTPINYLLMKKIMAAKTAIQKNSELTQIAYQYNFTDMAHFSRTFKRYIGISPKVFQDRLIPVLK